MTKQSILKFSVLLLLTLISHEKLSANDFELFREIYRTESKKTAESLKHIKGRYQKISTGTDATLKQQSYIDKRGICSQWGLWQDRHPFRKIIKRKKFEFCLRTL